MLASCHVFLPRLKIRKQTEALKREAAALMSELLRGHFPTGLEKDYTVAGNSRGCWFSNPFYSAFVSAFSCVLPLGWARRKSALAALLISMHEADICRAGIRAERHQSFYTALGSRQRARWWTQPSTWAWRGHTMWHGMGLARCCLRGRACDSRCVRSCWRYCDFSPGKQGRSVFQQWK